MIEGLLANAVVWQWRIERVAKGGEFLTSEDEFD